MKFDFTTIEKKRNIIDSTIRIKNAAEYEEVRLLQLLEIKCVLARKKAPKKTYKTPRAEKMLVPNGSDEITTPKKPVKIAKTLIILILALRKK